MKTVDKRNKLFLLILATILIFIFIIASIFIDRKQIDETYSMPDFVYNDIEYNKKDNIDLMLFVGLDTYDRYIKDSYRNEYCADSLVLFVLDNKEKTITPIYINSDTMCNYNLLDSNGKIVRDTYGQISISHTYGSGDLDSLINVKNAVSDLLTRISIDYYFSMSMDAIPILNDSVGGVSVYVEEDFSKVDSSIIKDQNNLLNGNQAFKYVVAKEGIANNSNTNRIKRHEKYVESLFNKAKKLTKENENLVGNTFNSISKYIASNTDIYGLVDLTNTFLEYDLLEPILLEGEEAIGEDGKAQYIVNNNTIVTLCINKFYDEIR